MTIVVTKYFIHICRNLLLWQSKNLGIHKADLIFSTPIPLKQVAMKTENALHNAEIAFMQSYIIFRG